MTALDLLSKIEQSLPRLRALAETDGAFLWDNYGDDLETAAELLEGVVDAFEDDAG